MNSIVYIFVKKGKVKVLDNQTTQHECEDLIKKRWKHTATLDTRIFLEKILNSADSKRLNMLINLMK